MANGNRVNPFTRFLLGGYDVIVEMLLAYDATVQLRSRCYRSDADALQTSSLEGHDKIVGMLLTKGANANV